MNDIGGFRPNLTQPSLKVNLGGNPTKSDGEYVLSTIKLKSWDFDELKIRFQRVEVIRRSYGTADKVDEGMAYKIRLER